MTPIQYWENIVTPLIGRFEKEQTATELAFAACIAVDHIRDYLPNSIPNKIDWLALDNDEFRLIFAISSAAKHLEAKDKRHGDLNGLRADSANIGTGAAFKDGTFFSDGTSWDDIDDVVRTRRPDGSLVDVLWVIKTVKTKIENKLRTLTSPASSHP